METGRYPHAGYLVVKAVVAKETAASPQLLRHFPEANTKKQTSTTEDYLMFQHPSFIKEYKNKSFYETKCEK